MMKVRFIKEIDICSAKCCILYIHSRTK